ncbi:MAG: Clp1/GlmU family protein [Candidatus Hadarchaeales archaeon]
MSMNEINPQEVYRAEGEIKIRIVEGEILVSGGLRKKGEEIVIPRAKSVPVEGVTRARVECILGPNGKWEKLPERTIPREWETLIDEIKKKRPRSVLVMGTVDVGKTFFTTYLGNTLLQEGIKAAVVDTDVGQADVGPPTVMGLGVFEKPVALLYEVPVKSAYFVGSMSPSGHLLEFVTGIKWLVERGMKLGDLVIVNTPGWVMGGPGRCMQFYSRELINPDLIIALQRKDELEHVLKTASPSKIRRLPVSTRVRPRNPNERAEIRALLLRRYFENSGKIVLNLERVRFERSYFRTGQEVDPREFGGEVIYAEKMPEGPLLVVNRCSDEKMEELRSKFPSARIIVKGMEENMLVGLVDDNNEFIGLGIVEKIDYVGKKMTVITPIKDPMEVCAVQIGSMKITPEGREVGTIRPGTF